MSTIPLSQLRKGAVAHIDSIVPNPVFGELDALVSRRLADLGFSSGMPLQVIAAGASGAGRLRCAWATSRSFRCGRKRRGRLCAIWSMRNKSSLHLKGYLKASASTKLK